MNQVTEYDGRIYPQFPTIAASAVVINDGKILMIKRAREPNKGKWSIPGGRIELGESIHEAVKREVSEECNIEIEILRLLEVSDNIIRDEERRVRYHYVLIDVLARYKTGEVNAQSDAEDYRWVTVEELSEMDMSPQLRTILLRLDPDLLNP